MLKGPGSELFRMHSSHPGTLFWPGSEYATTNDPMTPPPFQYITVPEHVQDEINREGVSTGTWELLETAGVEKLYWRQPLKHIEPGFWSEDVYAAMKGLIGDQLSHYRSFEFIPSTAETSGTTYYEFRIGTWPNERRAEDRLRLQDYAIPELCTPALPDDAVVAGKFRRACSALNWSVELAVPSWLDRGSEKVLRLGSARMVTKEFVDRWQATEISKHLREDNWETDLWFVPSNVGFESENIDYRWVDVPIPEGIEL